MAAAARKQSVNSALAMQTAMNRPLQAVFVAATVVPPVLAAYADPNGAALVAKQLAQTFSTCNAYAWSTPFLLASLALCVERVCYTMVWCFTATFKAFCDSVRGTPLRRAGETEVDVIVKLFGVNKLFQYGGFGLFFLCVAPVPDVFATNSLFQWIVGLQMVILGQILNTAIYRAIGKNGVYYGCKFGMHIPWCSGFPFNVVTAHPQYLGAVLTVYGGVLLSASPAHVAAGYFGLAHVQALLYVYMAYVEHNL